MAQKDSKKSIAKKLKSPKKPAAKKVDSKKKKAKSELKKLVMKTEKRAAKSSKSATAEATAPKKPAPKKPAEKQPSVGKRGAEVRQAGPVRARRMPATTSAAPSATWNVIALRAHARAAGVTGYSRMKKDELLAHLGVH